METLKTFLRIPVGSTTPTHKIVVSRDNDGFYSAMDMDIAGYLIHNTNLRDNKHRQCIDDSRGAWNTDALARVCDHLGARWYDEEDDQRDGTQAEKEAYITEQGAMWDYLKVAGYSQGEYGHFLQILTREDIASEWGGDCITAQAYMKSMRDHYKRAFLYEVFCVDSEELTPISEEEGKRHKDTLWHNECAYAVTEEDSLCGVMLDCDEHEAEDKEWKDMLVGYDFCSEDDALASI